METPGKPRGTLGCDSNISYWVTPTWRVWRAHPSAPTAFCSCNKQTGSGQKRRLRRFCLCQRLVLLVRMSLHFLCLDLLLSAWRLCSLSASQHQQWCWESPDVPQAQQRHNCQLHIPWVMRETCSTVWKYMAFLIFWTENKQVYSYSSEAFLTIVEEEACPKPKFHQVPSNWCWTETTWHQSLRTAARVSGTHSSCSGVLAPAAPMQQDPHCPLSPCTKHSPISKTRRSEESPHPHPVLSFDWNFQMWGLWYENPSSDTDTTFTGSKPGPVCMALWHIYPIGTAK